LLANYVPISYFWQQGMPTHPGCHEELQKIWHFTSNPDQNQTISLRLAAASSLGLPTNLLPMQDKNMTLEPKHSNLGQLR